MPSQSSSSHFSPSVWEEDEADSIVKSKYPCSNTSSKYIPNQTLEEMFGNLDYDVEASDDEYFWFLTWQYCVEPIPVQILFY